MMPIFTDARHRKAVSTTRRIRVHRGPQDAVRSGIVPVGLPTVKSKTFRRRTDCSPDPLSVGP